jgi:hypothetical protein
MRPAMETRALDVRTEDSIQHYAALSYPVFPLKARGKAPATTNGLRDATTDPATITHWLKNPVSNWAILPPERVIVVDVDDADLLASLETTYPELATCPKCCTPRGGAHYYLRLPDGALPPPTAAKVQPGIDVRGLNNAYLAAPPSITPNGQYSWQRELVAPDDLPAISEVLLQHLTPNKTLQKPLDRPSTPLPKSDSTGSRYAQAALQYECDNVSTAPEGVRNDTLNKAAFSLGQLVEGGELDESEVADTLTHAALQAGLEPNEVASTFESGFSAGKQKPRTAPPPTRPALESTTSTSEDETEPDPRRIIVNNRHMRDITEDSIRVLQMSNDPKPYLFMRSGMLCRVDDQARIEPLNVPSLKGIMDRAGDYVKEEYAKGELTRLPARPPADVANDILHLPDLPFPQLDAVATVPQVLPSGAILSENGYNPETKTLLHAPGLDTLQSDMPLEQAKDLIVNQLLGDFPFTDLGGLARALALLLQSFIILLISGACPLFLIDAPTRGTGKTLLYKVIARIVLGGFPAVMTLTRDGDELDKRITASLLEGDVMMVFDNVPTKLESDKLAAVITTRRYRGRRLGKTEMLTVANNATIVATGNNVEVSDEMARRIMPIRLDAGVERPEEGRSFRHDDLEGWVEANRSLLVSACLSIINAWVKAGMPLAQETIGSFESWAQVMGGILNHAGIPGLLSDREHFADAADQETNEWRTLTHFWYQTFGQRAVNASEIFNEVIKPNDLLLDLWAGRKDLSAKQRIGRALTTRRDRVFGKYAIRSAGQDPITRNAAYRLEKREPAHLAEKHPKQPDDARSTVQDDENGMGVSKTETPTNTRKHPIVPEGCEGKTLIDTRKHLKNTQVKNGVQDSKNTDERVLRVFQEGLSLNATKKKDGWGEL